MQDLGYYNGSIGRIDEMVIPMNDRVCWFGDGVYDAGPCRNYHIFAVDEHIDRFFRSAADHSGCGEDRPALRRAVGRGGPADPHGDHTEGPEGCRDR